MPPPRCVHANRNRISHVSDPAGTNAPMPTPRHSAQGTNHAATHARHPWSTHAVRQQRASAPCAIHCSAVRCTSTHLSEWWTAAVSPSLSAVRDSVVPVCDPSCTQHDPPRPRWSHRLAVTWACPPRPCSPRRRPPRVRSHMQMCAHRKGKAARRHTPRARSPCASR